MPKRSGDTRERAPKRKADLFELLVGAPSLSAQFDRIGGNLTPGRVSQILQQADSGQPYQLVDLFHELRQKDAAVQQAFQAREVCVASIPFDIAPPGDEPLKRDMKCARLCRLALQRCETFETGLSHWVGEGNAFGHATSEVVWKMEEDGELAGLMVPDYLSNISARRYAFRQSDGELVFIPSAGASPDALGVDQLRDAPLGKYIQYRPRVNGDVIAREGLVRLIVWMALFRNFDIRDWLQLAEMGWKPKRTGKYKKDASKQDKAALLAILERLTTSGVAIYPETVELLMQWPTNFSQQSTHKEFADFLGKEIGKAVLGTPDVTEQSTKNGARAAVETRNQLRTDLRNWDAVGLAKLLTKQLVLPFYRFNFSPNIQPGTYVPLLEDPTDPVAFATSIDLLTKRGLKIGADWVRKKIGAPAPKKNEELLSSSDGSPTKPQDPNGDPGKPADPGQPDPAADPAEQD